MTRKNRDKVVALIEDYWKWDKSSFPVKYRPLPKWLSQTGTTNGLTNLVIHLIRLKGWHAERIPGGGRAVDGTKIVKDVMGNSKTIGSVRHIPSTGQDGTSDVAAVINGIHYAIEIKNENTKDRIAHHQAVYGRIIQECRGQFCIIKSADNAVEFLETLPFNPDKERFWAVCEMMSDKKVNGKTYKYLMV